MQGVVRIAGLIVLGAILANVLRNPKGTKALFGGVSNLWRTSLQGVSGQRIR
jgi:hypothetical protein